MNKLIISVYDIFNNFFDGNVDPVLFIIIIVTVVIVLLKFRCYM